MALNILFLMCFKWKRVYVLLFPSTLQTWLLIFSVQRALQMETSGSECGGKTCKDTKLVKWQSRGSNSSRFTLSSCSFISTRFLPVGGEDTLGQEGASLKLYSNSGMWRARVGPGIFPWMQGRKWFWILGTSGHQLRLWKSPAAKSSGESTLCQEPGIVQLIVPIPLNHK